MIKQLYNNDTLWQMSAAERMAMFYLFDRMKNKSVAIEVGSYKGGFTQQLVKYFDTVVSIDIDHSNIVDKELYSSVHFYTGDSAIYLPSALTKHQNVSFILIDADHSFNAVYIDIMNSIHYAYNPIILVHDAVYSETRLALEEIKANDTSLFIDLDFVPATPFEGTYYGGLALIYKSKDFTDL